MDNNTYNQVDFGELGAAVGAPVSMHRFGDREMPMVEWNRELELKALELLKEQAKNGKPFRFSGHPSKWLLCAITDALLKNGVTMYIPGLDTETPLKPFPISTEADGISQTEISQAGDWVTVRFTFQDVSPVDMHNMRVPPIPAGKNVVIIATGHPILPSVCMALSYGPDSQSVWVTAQAEDATCFCAITHTPAFSLGEERPL